MQDFIKITLSPTRLMQAYAAEATGSILYDPVAERVSINLFNLPDPTPFTRQSAAKATYKGWLYHPDTGATHSIGTLSPDGESLYYLYDAPFRRSAGFEEIMITAEPPEAVRPEGEILLIGYFAREQTQSMTAFQPFDPPLPNHRWWKLQHDTSKALPAEAGPPCRTCPRHRALSSLAGAEDHGFHLPELIGTAIDESGLLQFMVHAIPGRLLRSDQPGQGRTGYLYWHPYYGMEERAGAIGYWLCYIHPETNRIATPFGVSIPPG